jgi:hypothetical protein
MSNKNRASRGQFGSAATTEAARRQLMQPVSCWEKTWFTPEGSKVKVRKWAQTKTQPVSTLSMRFARWLTAGFTQQWSDDEGDNINQPLAPLPDAEVMDLDEDDEAGEQEADAPEATPAVESTAEAPAVPTEGDAPPVAVVLSEAEADVALEATEADLTMPLETDLTLPLDAADADLTMPLDVADADLTMPLDVADTDLTMSLDATDADLTLPPLGATDTDLTMPLDAPDTDLSLPLDTTLSASLGDGVGALDPSLELSLPPATEFAGDLAVDVGAGLDDLTSSAGLDMLPPDGTAFEAAHDLTQVEPGDSLLGGQVMDASSDPFGNVS